MNGNANQHSALKISKALENTQLENAGIGKLTYDCMRKYADRICVTNTVTKRRYTYEEVGIRSIRVALELRARGVKAGDVITVSSANQIDLVWITTALLYLNVVYSPLSSGYTPEQLEATVKLTKPRVIFCDKKSKNLYERLVKAENMETEVVVLGEASFLPFLRPHPNEEKFRPVVVEKPYESVAMIISTSGTTKTFYKSVNMVHGAVFDYLIQYVDSGDYFAVTLINFPYISGGLVTGLTMLCGGEMILLPEFNPVSSLEAIQQHKVTYIRVVSDMLLAMVRCPTFYDYNMSSVKYICIYGQPIFKNQMQECREKFNRAFIINTYGCIEAPTIFKFGEHEGKEFIDSKSDSVGKLWRSDVTAKLIDINTKKQTGPNEIGEIIVKGPHLFNGYFNNPEESAKVLDKDGWLHTGDLGYLDEDQCLYIVGRLAGVIKYKGFMIVPTEIEKVLLTHPAVEYVSVIGKEDATGGEVPVAFVAKKAGTDVSEQDLLKYVADHLADEKRLRGGVIFLDALPRTPFGKVHVVELRRILAERK